MAKELIYNKPVNAEEIAERMIRVNDLKSERRIERILSDEIKISLIRHCLNTHSKDMSSSDRMAQKHIYTALAYLGYKDAALGLSYIAYKDMEAAKTADDSEAVERAIEEQEFWQTVDFLCNEWEENIRYAFALLRGIGCQKDEQMAKEVYARIYFDKLNEMTEEEKQRLVELAERKSSKKPFTTEMVRALISGDRDGLLAAMDKAIEAEEEMQIESVHNFIYISRKKPMKKARD